MKMILAAVLAGTFLLSLPVKAADKTDDGAKAGKSDKKEKKADKKADKGDKKADDKGAKPAGGGW